MWLEVDSAIWDWLHQFETYGKMTIQDLLLKKYQEFKKEFFSVKASVAHSWAGNPGGLHASNGHEARPDNILIFHKAPGDKSDSWNK